MAELSLNHIAQIYDNTVQALFDFKLDENDRQALAALDTGSTLFFSHTDPASAERFAMMGKRR